MIKINPTNIIEINNIYINMINTLLYIIKYNMTNILNKIKLFNITLIKINQINIQIKNKLLYMINMINIIKIIKNNKKFL